MVVQLSVRKSLRWVPGEASEATDTLVLDVGDYFVDLRVLKAAGTIDWAMAGKRTILAENPLKVQWSKEMCSMNSEDSDDVGIFEDLPNGDSLEKGSMPNPDNNDQEQEYEEVWGALAVEKSEEANWILRRKDDSGITYLGRVGDYYQGMKKAADGSFSAVREEKAGKDSWKTKYAIGSGLASIAKMGEAGFNTKSWSQGDEVEVAGEKYLVYALEKA